MSKDVFKNEKYKQNWAGRMNKDARRIARSKIKAADRKAFAFKENA